MRAEKLPSGNYRAQKYIGRDINGKKIVKSFTAPTAWEAIKAAEEYAEKNGIGMSSSQLSVEAALNRYIEARSSILSASSLNSYRTIRDHRLQSIMKIPVGSLKLIDVQNAVNIDAGRLSRRSVKGAVSLVESALRSQGIDLMLTKRITFPRQLHEERSLPELKDVLSAVMGTDIELPCLLSMWLSLRISEVRGIKFSDIDHEKKLIQIRRALVYTDGKDVLNEFNKTYKSTRTIPLSQYLYDKITALPQNKEEFVIKMGYNKIYKQFKKITAAKGMNIRFHDLRGEFASALGSLNIPYKYIEKLGGWSSATVMERVYLHTFSEQEKVYQKMIDGLFESLIRNSEG